MVEKIRPSFVVKDDRLAQLKELFPEAAADGSIHWESLREALADFLEDDTQEHFGLSWPGKREAKKMAFVPPKATLRMKKGEGVREEESGNLIIEGDNLEVLKLLQKSYFQSIKMIYIDPPYNTGNDFVYNDDFTDTVEDYLRKTGQLDAEGKPLATNPKTSGRYHSNWLSMMYPRLVLAKNLLRDDGVIFVSIDDNEVHHLRQIMDEIFGEENIIAQLIWKKSYGGGSKTKYVVGVHEYVLLYGKNKEVIGKIELPPNPNVLKYYKYQDSNFLTRGPYRTQPLATTSMDERPNLRYPIIWQDVEIWPEKQWFWSADRTREALDNNELVISKKKEKWNVEYKQYLRDENGVERGSKPFSIYDGPYTQIGTDDLASVGLSDSGFSFPKPVGLIKELLKYVSSDAIILDFFAGSGTTAQSIFELNEEDGGDRKFILVQLPEPTGRQDYPTVADITKERVRRVVAKLDEAKVAAPKPEKKKKNSAELFTADGAVQSTNYAAGALATHDRGFRVYELAESNLKNWDPAKATDLTSLEKELELFTDPLKEGWKKEDLLVEILLWEGFSLTSGLEKRKAGGNLFFIVTDPGMSYRLLVCLDGKLSFTQKDLDSLALAGDDVVVFLDSSLSDGLKSRLADMLKLKVL